MLNDKEIKLKNLLEKEQDINKIGSEIKEVKKINNEFEKFKKEVTSTENKFIKYKKDFCVEKIEVFKFIAKQELKNIDVILDILKFTTSLSISIFVASLTTTYFSKEIYIIIYINTILIILLVMFIVARNKILSNNKTILFKVLEESNTIMCDDIILKCNDFKEKLKEFKVEIN